MNAATRRPALPRLLHPLAWWAWGIGMAVAASRTTNPALLIFLITVTVAVTLARREQGTTNVLWLFLAIGLFVIALRLVMAIVFGGGITGRIVLFELPRVPLPDFFGSVRIGGRVTAERLLFALYEGLQLAAILVAVGAANALASPRRMLRYLPATLYDVGTAVVVALTYAPQMVTDARRVRAARRLRGHSGRGLRDTARLIMPVLDSGLERSLDLAASMESRGYGRSVTRSVAGRRTASVLTLCGSLGVLIGLYGLADASQPGLLGLPTMLLGAGMCLAALLVGARRDRRSAYRRDPWELPEWLVTLTGIAPAALFIGVDGIRASLSTSVQPPEIPALPVLALVACLIPVLAIPASPVPPLRAVSSPSRGAAPTSAGGRSSDPDEVLV